MHGRGLRLGSYVPLMSFNNLISGIFGIFFPIFMDKNVHLYTRYPIVARALGLAAFRPSASREQRYLAYKMYTCFANFVHSLAHFFFSKIPEIKLLKLIRGTELPSLRHRPCMASHKMFLKSF